MDYDFLMNIIFAAASSFSEQTLIALTKLDHSIVAVLTQPDRRSGRGLKKTENPIKFMARTLELPVLEYESLTNPEAYETINKLAPDLLLTMAYGGHVPEKILKIPRCDAIKSILHCCHCGEVHPQYSQQSFMETKKQGYV